MILMKVFPGKQKELLQAFTRLRRKPRAPARGGMRVSSDLSGEALVAFGAA